MRSARYNQSLKMNFEELSARQNIRNLSEFQRVSSSQYVLVSDVPQAIPGVLRLTSQAQAVSSKYWFPAKLNMRNLYSLIFLSENFAGSEKCRNFALQNFDMTTDEQYMARAIQISRFAEGRTMPNPMVGALIVHDGTIIAEGYHHKAGEPHAEPNAVRNAEDSLRKKYNGDLVKVAKTLNESTLYVTLEPCSHYGKTPPCAKLIVEKNIHRVVIGCLDCNPLVAGRGVEMLREAGIIVDVGILERECRWVNRRFFTFHEKKRPYVVLKWAQTADGYIDLKRTEKGNGPHRISNAVTKTLNHQMRCYEAAIMVATRTAILDDPHLTVTKWSGLNPVRVLLDRCLRVPKDSRIFDNAARTIVFTEKNDFTGYGENVEFRTIDFSDNLVKQLFDGLYNCGIQSIIIEGGAQWLNTVIESSMWDEAHIEISQTIVGQGVAAPHIDNSLFETSEILGNHILTLNHRPIILSKI